MKRKIELENSTRAKAFELWMDSPMPMVTLTKRLDITNLVRISRKSGLKLNMLMCHCIGKAAMEVSEFMTLPEEGGLYEYDQLAINVIVKNRENGINSCDVPYTTDIKEFNREYLQLTEKAADSCESSFLPESMIVGTSAMTATELDTIVNQYTKRFLNPMVMWGKYHKKLWHKELSISFQFHHVQMDGMQGAEFLEILQNTIRSLIIS